MNTKKVIAGRIKPAFLCQIFRFYIYLFIIVYYDENITHCWSSSMVMMKNSWLELKAKLPDETKCTQEIRPFRKVEGHLERIT